MQNIVPVIDEVYYDRKDYPFGIVKAGKTWQYGHCAVRVDARNRVVQPPVYIRGDIARVYLYMHRVYGKNGKNGLPLSRTEIKLFTAWHKSDPPDSWELERNRIITKLQGIGNPYLRRKGVLYEN